MVIFHANLFTLISQNRSLTCSQGGKDEQVMALEKNVVLSVRKAETQNDKVAMRLNGK